MARRVLWRTDLFIYLFEIKIFPCHTSGNSNTFEGNTWKPQLSLSSIDDVCSPRNYPCKPRHWMLHQRHDSTAYSEQRSDWQMSNTFQYLSSEISTMLDIYPTPHLSSEESPTEALKEKWPSKRRTSPCSGRVGEKRQGGVIMTQTLCTSIQYNLHSLKLGFWCNFLWD